MININNLSKAYNVSKSLILKRPRVVLVDLTNKCNLECVFCHAHKEDVGVMKLTEWKKTLDQIKDWLGTAFIDFSGGEPLLNPDWYEIIKHSNNIGLVTSLSTNGSLISEKVANKIMSLDIDSVYISFYGSESTQNLLMQRNNYDLIISGVRNLKRSRERYRAKTKIRARVLIHNKNLSEIDEILDSIKHNGFDSVVFKPLTFRGDLMSKYSKNTLWVNDKKKMNYCIDKIKVFKKSGFNVMNSYEGLELMYHYYCSDKGLQNSNQKQCRIPFKRIYVLCDGHMKVCCLDLGNVRRSSPKSLYNSSIERLNNCSKSCRRKNMIGSIGRTIIKEKATKAYTLIRQ